MVKIFAPLGAGRFDDMYSVRLDGAPDDDNIIKRRIRRTEETRKNVVAKLLQRGTVAKLFKKLDSDGSGDIDYAELKSGLAKLGLSVMTQDADDLIASIDTDNDGKITLEEFTAFMEGDWGDEKVKQFDKYLEEERRRKMVTHSKPQADEPCYSFSKQSDREMLSTFTKYTNGKKMTSGRRTSAALGFGMRQTIVDTERETRKQLNRKKARTTFFKKVKAGGKGGLTKLFKKMDKDGSGSITFKELKIALDHMGLSVAHQDSNGLMKMIDKNGDGVIDFEEFQQILEMDHEAAIEKQEEQEIVSQQKWVGKEAVAPKTERPYMRPTKKFAIRVARTGGKNLQGTTPLINKISEAELRARRVQHLRDSQPGSYRKKLIPLNSRPKSQFAVGGPVAPHPPARDGRGMQSQSAREPSQWLANQPPASNQAPGESIIFSPKLSLPIQTSWRDVYQHNWRNKVQCKVVSGVACTPGRSPYVYTHNVHPLSGRTV